MSGFSEKTEKLIVEMDKQGRTIWEISKELNAGMDDIMRYLVMAKSKPKIDEMEKQAYSDLHISKTLGLPYDEVRKYQEAKLEGYDASDD